MEEKKEQTEDISFLNELSDDDYAYCILSALFEKTVKENWEEEQQVSDRYIKEHGIKEGSPFHSLFKGFELGFNAALDILNTLNTKES